MRDPLRCPECGGAAWISEADDGYLTAVCPTPTCARIVVQVLTLPFDLVTVDDD